MTVKYISNSQIGMWLRCPKQYEYRYVKGLKIPPKGYFVVGSAYHGALSENFKYKMEHNSDLDIDSVLDAYDTYWNDRLKGKFGDRGEEDDLDQPVSIKEVDWEDDKPEEVKDMGYNLVQTYHKRVAPNIFPIAVEEKSEKQIDDNTIYIGYIDVEREKDIIDHKLMKRSMNQEAANKDIQPLSYYLLSGKGKFSYHIAVKKKIPEIQIVNVQHNKQDLKWWTDAVKQIVDQMNTGIAPPNPTSWLCSERFCGYWSLCKGGK